MKQFLIMGRLKPTKQVPEPTVFRMRVFAQNEVIARSRFWNLLREQKKIKRTHAELLATQEIKEAESTSVKLFGIALKYRSRTGIHNMYKEYRSTTLSGAVSKMIGEMAGTHKAKLDTINVIRTCRIIRKKDIKRPHSVQYSDKNVKFPLMCSTIRAPMKKYKTVCTAQRPLTAY
jgi:large subunit ribosomal protein L18Ae